MKHLKYIFAGALATALVFSSCSKDFLDTYPTDQVSEAEVGTTASDLMVAINGIHRKMVSQDRSNQGMGGEGGFIVAREASGDDMTWPANSWHQGLLNWSANTSGTNTYNTHVWRTYYEFILNCNKILEKWEGIKDDVDQKMVKYTRGETLAIRAWAYFQLVQYYGHRYDADKTNTQLGVPLKTSSELQYIARNTVEEVYKFINDDLTEAAGLLEGYKPNDINHYSQAVVYGLLARVALVQQNYKAAGDYAAKAIELAEASGHAIMNLEQADPEQTPTVFPDISKETKDAMYAALTEDDQTVYFYSYYAFMSWNFNATVIRQGIKCISQSTYDLMSETDVRRAWWDPTGKAAVPTSSYTQAPYQNRKFTARSTADAVGDVAFMRLTEMYLIASEAYARADETTTAKQYFAKFIAERDPEYTDLGNTGHAFAEEVMNHRRLELWGEGFRWFDLKRLNLPVDRKGSNFNTTFCGFLYKAVDADGWVYEIPESETNYNKEIVKNY